MPTSNAHRPTNTFRAMEECSVRVPVSEASLREYTSVDINPRRTTDNNLREISNAVLPNENWY